jgi:hypothetical protein
MGASHKIHRDGNDNAQYVFLVSAYGASESPVTAR